MRRNAARPLQHRIAQRGQILLVILAILGIGFGLAFYTFIGPTGSTVERDKITAAALAQAKAALIGYAAGVSNLAGGERPGDLPCPDTNDSGITGTSCGNAAGTTGQTSRIGRLPWKSLGLPDLRDGDGERLWYAVSNSFKYKSRTTCAAPGAAGCLNSDARGTITVRNASGAIVNDGSNPDAFTPSGVVAVIFAPGAVLQRQGAATPQDRTCTNAGGSCTAAEVCNSSPTTNTAKCNPVNYLDTSTGIEDNADFIDGSSTNGFINGVIRDAGGNAIVNDRLITITYQDLMPVIQRRVAKEALNCLANYANNNRNRFPWATRESDISSPYPDKANYRFGRLPDNLDQTASTSDGYMSNNWPISCSITQGSWWMNWKELVFYGVAAPYQPEPPTWLGWSGGGWNVPLGGPCSNNCLRVDPPSTNRDKRTVIIVAGTRLSSVNSGQPRSSSANKSNPSNYVEDQNDGGSTQYWFTELPVSSSFNDLVLYQ